jgi:hypothetical protein
LVLSPTFLESGMNIELCPPWTGGINARKISLDLDWLILCCLSSIESHLR